MTVSKIGLTQTSTIDSLESRLAYAQYIALQEDSLLNAQYAIIAGKNKQIETFRVQRNKDIKTISKVGLISEEQTKTALKTNNKLAKANKANLKWFGIGAGTGVGVGIIGILAIMVGTK